MTIPYILIALIVLAVIFGVLTWKKRKNLKPISTLSALAFSSVIAGIVFSEDKFIGYGLIALGLVLALADIFIKSKRAG